VLLGDEEQVPVGRGLFLPMILRIDTEARVVEAEDASGMQRVDFDDPKAFELVSKAWLQLGWEAKHTYRFTWLGRPIIQLPEDMIRLQEVVVALEPDVIIETGVAHGGSLIFFASLCELLGKGRVIGVERELRAHNEAAIAEHPLGRRVTVVQGDSADRRTFERVRDQVGPDDRVFVFLDSNHSKGHVLRELELYAPLVSIGSYIVVADGIVQDLADVPRSGPHWSWDNPLSAIDAFLAERDDFVQEDPPRPFQESHLDADVTYWPRGWLRRCR
jgi:cephalosporin hydroxylase